jgi:hypothetical protein
LVRIIDADATTLGRSEEGVRGFEAKTKAILALFGEAPIGGCL